jgi:serine/threonine-protein kinase
VERAPVDETQFVPDGDPVTREAVTRDAGTPDDGARTPTFGRFRVLGLLGTGASGSVYRAHDDVLGRPVAIKALHPNCDPTVRARFVHEARAVGALLHPNIVASFDAGIEGDTPYLVMELARGSLRERMRSGGGLDVDTVRSIGIQIARALAAAHAANILHRDVKPANILVSGLASGDTWKLGDFGIARLPDSTLTDTGQFLGSPSYAAPESLRAATFTPASDVYALAATLYEALAGAPPHGDHDMPSVVRKLEHDAPPLYLRCAVPRPLSDAIMTALSRDPEQRPTAAAFASQLASANSDADALVVVDPPPPARASHRAVRTAFALAFLAVALLVVAVLRVLPEDASTAKSTRPPSSTKAADAAKPDAKRTKPPTKRAKPAAPPPVAKPVEPPAPRQTAPSAPPVDPWDRIADEEATRALLEQLERDARDEFQSMRGRSDRRGRRRR